VSYSVETCEPGGAWQPFAAYRTDLGALCVFDRLVLLGSVGVRVCCGRVQVAAYWPRRAA
jgi:hypothetical protein